MQHKLPGSAASHELALIITVITIASEACSLIWLSIAVAAVICGGIVELDGKTNPK